MGKMADAMGTNREWIEKTLSHRQPEAVPYNFSFSPPAQQALQQHYQTADLEGTLAIPIRTSGPESIKPLYAPPAEFGTTATDEFGVVWSTSEINRGTPIGPCLGEPDLSDYRFPDPTAAYRFEGLSRWCQANQAHYTILWIGDLWERATFMRGMEKILLDVALHPKFVEQLLEQLTAYILETSQRLFENFRFDGVAISDDYGTQHAMILSPEHWRRFIKPRLKEIYGLAKKHGRSVFHHSCGNIYPIIGDLIDIGLDILHPIQPEAMDVFQLKREFGRHLTLCGGVRTQDLLPTGTPDQIRDEVRRLKHELGRDGGYILEPGITLQADVPLENMLAVIEAAKDTN